MKKFITAVAVAVCLSLTCSAGRTLYIGHRGCPDAAPENTLSSFRAAVASGADAVECDVRLSSDGHLVLMHDGTTGRVWNEDIVPEQSTLGEIKKLRLNSGFKAAFPHSAGESVPELCELVEILPAGTVIFTELKTDTEQARDALLDEIKRLGIEERTVFISFSRAAIVYALERGQRSAWLVSCTSTDEVLGLDIPRGAALDVNLRSLDANTAAELHARGYTVYAWNAENTADCRRAELMGVDGITCNARRDK